MLGAISGYSSFFSPVSYYHKPAGGLENPVDPVTPVKAEPTATAGRSTGLIAGYSLPAMREGADPAEMAVRMRIKNAEDAENAPAAENKAAGAEEAQKALEKAGFFMRASGVSTYYSNTTTAERQSVAGGDVAAIGTVIDVRFFNQVEDGYAG